MNFNLFNTIIFSGIVYGLVFAITAIINPNFRHKATLFLALTVLSLSLSNLQYWIRDVYNISIPDLLYVQFELLIIPFFFIFLTKLISLKLKWSIVVFAPFFLATIYQYWSGINHEYKYHVYVELGTIVFNIMLIGLVLYHLQNYRRGKDQIDHKVRTGWIIKTIYIGAILILFWVIVTFTFRLGDQTGLEAYYPLWIGISILIYFIGQKSLVDIRTLNERARIRELNSNNAISIPHIERGGYDTFEKIENEIQTSKLYLNPNLTLSSVAKLFDISPGYLSQLMGRYSKNGFNDLINYLRVEESKKMLGNKDFHKYTNVAIGLEAGFNSKSSFFAAFKKHTGKTPNEFRKSIHL
ncbi:helix-turn-helix domain-containing protein [Flagellimonas beolgyonensis]|uniref:helix-turn-helix domain-containing protein n=1 Tax=Flagellimonas beolgyonensis TaxID=864064 RepID=UPI000F8D590C|nr:helix-turn-helix domain-containing protein [Allomuricauda beolgyonensis]